MTIASIPSFRFLLILCSMVGLLHNCWSQRFEYTAEGKLATAWYPSGQVITYTYDPAGNLTGVAVFADEDLDGIHDQWELFFFGGPNAADPSIDSDKDSLDDFMEFALGRNPYLSDAAGSTSFSVIPDASEKVIEFSYRKDKTSALFNNYRVEVSTDLENWFSGPDYVKPVGLPQNIDSKTQELRFRVLTPASPGTQIFVRLDVQKKQ